MHTKACCEASESLCKKQFDLDADFDILSQSTTSSNSCSASTVSDTFESIAASSAHGDSVSLRIRACSWNLNGKEVSGDDDLRQWLIGASGMDVLVIGLQELVELKPASV